MAKTKIEWATDVWNPIAGCSDVSAGCKNCYARGMAKRLQAMGVEKYQGLTVMQGSHNVWTGKISFDEVALLKPLSWKKPRRIFVNSMSDLFHENVTGEMQDKIFAVMALCPQHTFQILTKRPKTMADYVDGRSEPGCDGIRGALVEGMAQRIYSETHPDEDEDDISMWLAVKWPLPNVLLGTSVENQKAADERLDYLCKLGSHGWQTMVSFEPLLGSVDPGPRWLSLGARTWAIVGGESGPGARPMRLEWAKSLLNQCAAAGVPFFLKQLGRHVIADPLGFATEDTWHSDDDREGGPLLKDRKGGDWTEWPESLRVRQFPEVNRA